MHMRYNERIMADQSVLRWRAYEHEYVEHGSDWYWALGIVAVSAALMSILFRDFLFGIILLLGAVVLGLHARVKPELVEFEVSDRGIRTAGTLHNYKEILAFWVEDEKGPNPLLLVDTTKIMSPNLIIPIQNIDPHEVRLFLRRHAKEVPMREPVAHKILEMFGL